MALVSQVQSALRVILQRNSLFYKNLRNSPGLPGLFLWGICSGKKVKTDGGWGGIRTHEELSPLPVFKTGAFNRSATHPNSIVLIVIAFHGEKQSSGASDGNRTHDLQYHKLAL